MNKKICLYIGSLSLGGIGKLMLHLMDEFIKKGYQVDVFLMKGGGEYESQVPQGVRIFVEKGSHIQRIRKFISYLNREKPDVSISARQRQDIGNILSCWLTKGKTIPVVSVHTNVTEENLHQKNKNKDNFFIKLLSKWLYKIPNKFIAVSSGVADDFSLRTGVQRNKIKVIYNPVYKPYIETVPQNVESIIDFLQNKKFIIGVGRLTEQKDFVTLITAFSIVSQTDPELKLLILGEGALRESLQSQIKKLNLQDKVFMPGFVDTPQYFLKRAELFVLSSQWEGFGNVIVEALGVGTKVISTDCPSGPAEILENGKYGKLVTVNNPQEMANAILDSLTEPNQPELLIERAKDFSTEKIAEEYLKCIFDEKQC